MVTYAHVGAGVSTPTLWPVNVTYSAGFVNKVKTPRSYAGPFIDIGGGIMYGLDYCWWPKGASAASFTIGSSYGLYIGGDYYHCIN